MDEDILNNDHEDGECIEIILMKYISQPTIF